MAHFSVSTAIAFGGYSAGAILDTHEPSRWALGATVGLGAGVLKELLDMTGIGQPSWKDFAWDCAGVAVGLALAWLIHYLIPSPTHEPAPGR